MNGDIRPSEEDVIAKWRNSKFDYLQPLDEGAVWVNAPSSEHGVHIVIAEVPVSVHQMSTTKYIDIVLVHTLPIDKVGNLISETIDAWSIADSGSPSLSGVERFMRNLLSLSNPNDWEVSLYEAKVKLNAKAIGQLLSYKETFSPYYSDTENLQIRNCGLIYWEADEIYLRTAAKNGFELCKVEFETSEFFEDQDRGSEAAPPFAPEKPTKAQQPQGVSDRPKPRLNNAELENRFPTPIIREQFVRLESHRRNQDDPMAPGVSYDNFASEILGERIVLDREEFIRAKQSPDSTGIGW